MAVVNTCDVQPFVAPGHQVFCGPWRKHTQGGEQQMSNRPTVKDLCSQSPALGGPGVVFEIERVSYQ